MTSHSEPANPGQPALRARRVTGLDGLRALAITAVLAYHLGLPCLPSGHLGVVLFLVLSGYLVASSLERRLQGGAASVLRGFFLGRLRRIWPPMALMAVVVCAWCVLFDHVLLTKLRPDFLPSLLLANNLAAIARGASYFDAIGGVSPLLHLWYLGLDAQFCLLWGVVALAGSRLGVDARERSLAALALAGASALAMALLFDPSLDPTRVYYGPDTRLFAPLLGAALAGVWPLGEDAPRLGAKAGPRLSGILRGWKADLVSLAALGLLVLMMVRPKGDAPFHYRGGMLLAALASCLLVCAALQGKTLLSRALGRPGLLWLGSRSFSLYLWHFPLFQVLRGPLDEGSVPCLLLALAASLALAELSWRFVESGRLARQLSGSLAGMLRVREGSNGESARDPSRRARPSARHEGHAPRTLPLALVGALTLVCVLGLALVPDDELVPREAIVNTGAGASEAISLSGDERDTGQAASADERTDLSQIPTGEIVLRSSYAEVRDGKLDPVMIGDSVPGDAHDEFDLYFPTGHIDSYVGRRPDQMAAVLNDYLAQGVVGNVVILEAFANSPVSDEELDSMIESCGERAVFLVTCHSSSDSASLRSNEALQRAAERHVNVQLIDWYGHSSGREDWIYPDGIHLKPEGQEPYISLIANAVSRSFAERGGVVRSREDDASKQESDAYAAGRAVSAALDASKRTLESAVADGLSQKI